MKKLLFIFLFILSQLAEGVWGGFSFAQNTTVIDSLVQVLKITKEDTTRINTLITLAWELKFNNPDTSIILSTQALEIINGTERSEANDLMTFFKKATANSHHNLGVFNYLKGNYPLALDFHNKALKIREQLNEKKGISASLGNIGIVYSLQGDYPKALEYYFKALKISEELDDKSGIASDLGNIGNIYLRQSDYPKALGYYFKALKISEEVENKDGVVKALGTIGVVYQIQGDYPKALEHFFKALKMSEELENKNLIAIWLDNIGFVYRNQGDNPKVHPVERDSLYNRALEYYFKSLRIEEEIGNKSGISATLSSIGSLYTEQEKYPEAERYLLQALEIDTTIGKIYGAMHRHQALSDLYTKTRQYQKAYEHYKEYSIAKDTLYNEEKSKEIGKLEAGFEYDKKLALEQAEHSKQSAVAASESKRQKVIIYAVSGGLLLVVMFLILLFNRFRIKQKANIVLKAKNEIIEKQKNNIIDSIDYAKRIQQSILVSEEDIQKHLPDSFIYYQPKDIVSGDFYWFSHQNDKSIIAAVDCTGHGVPGAFMSMIGNTLLNEIVNEKQITEPEVILSELHSAILNTLQQEGEDAPSQDGMDMALCVIDQENNLIRFAGAKIPLYIIRNGALEMIKADIHSIGGKAYMSGKEVEPKFTEHEIPIEKNMVIYMFSDGYMDQFGGELRKSFSSKSFKQLLLDNSKLKMHHQKVALGKAMEDWKGSYEQIDDMLVMGVRF